MQTGGALACGAIGACSTAPELPPPQGLASVPAPSPRQGQFWEYAVRDGYTGFARGLYRYTVARAEGDRIVVDVARDGERMDTYIYAPGWNGLEHPLTNLQRFRYDPAFPAFEFPLQAGKSWRRVVRATDPMTGRSYSVHIHASVSGWRRIRVPAGEFDALQVRRYVFAGNAEYFNLQEEIVQNDLYAPAVGFVAVTEGNSSHIDTSRSGGGRGRPLRVRGDWLIGELVRYSAP
jgi:hypothetical protein